MAFKVTITAKKDSKDFYYHDPIHALWFGWDWYMTTVGWKEEANLTDVWEHFSTEWEIPGFVEVDIVVPDENTEFED